MHVHRKRKIQFERDFYDLSKVHELHDSFQHHHHLFVKEFKTVYRRNFTNYGPLRVFAL